MCPIHMWAWQTSCGKFHHGHRRQAGPIPPVDRVGKLCQLPQWAQKTNWVHSPSWRRRQTLPTLQWTQKTSFVHSSSGQPQGRQAVPTATVSIKDKLPTPTVGREDKLGPQWSVRTSCDHYRSGQGQASCVHFHSRKVKRAKSNQDVVQMYDLGLSSVCRNAKETLDL